MDIDTIAKINMLLNRIMKATNNFAHSLSSSDLGNLAVEFRIPAIDILKAEISFKNAYASLLHIH